MIGKINSITLVLAALLVSTVTPIILKSGLGYPELSDAIRTQSIDTIDDMYVLAHILIQVGQSNDDVVKTVANRVLGEVKAGGSDFT